MQHYILGDALDTLRQMRDGLFNTCVTSPPYFGLRDYGHEGQIGLESTPDAYVARMVEVFREVRRVLRDDGTLWLNLGDSYARNGGTDRNVSSTGKVGNTLKTLDLLPDRKQRAPQGLKEKDLIGIPWRVAFALQADGWYLRQDIIWSKPNPMPESVTDRCTKAHEYIFMLTKSARYYYDYDAVREPVASSTIERISQPNIEQQAGSTRAVGKTNGNMKAVLKKQDGHGPRHSGFNERYDFDAPRLLRNRRSVWTVTTKPFKGAHFATFPPDLIEPCVLAGAPAQCCSKCGAPWECKMIDTGVVNESFKGSTFTDGKTGTRDGGDRTQKGDRTIKIAGDSTPSCKCGAASVPGLVLDPFGGAGTTNLVCHRTGRSGVYIDINPEYLAMARARVRQ